MPDDVGARLGGYSVGRHLNGRWEIAQGCGNMHGEPRVGSCRPQLAQSFREAQLVNGAGAQALHDAAHLGDGVPQTVAQPDGALSQVGVGPQVRRQAVELQRHPG